MKYDAPTDSDESVPIRLDSQGIPILQEVVVAETSAAAENATEALQPVFVQTLDIPGETQADALRQQLESSFQLTIEEQVEQLTRAFREQLTTALQQALSETLDQLSAPSGVNTEKDADPERGDDPTS